MISLLLLTPNRHCRKRDFSSGNTSSRLFDMVRPYWSQECEQGENLRGTWVCSILVLCEKAGGNYNYRNIHYHAIFYVLWSMKFTQYKFCAFGGSLLEGRLV